MEAQDSVTASLADPVEMAFVTQANPVLLTVVPVIAPLLCAVTASVMQARCVTWTVQVHHLNNLQTEKVVANPKSALIPDVVSPRQ